MRLPAGCDGRPSAIFYFLVVAQEHSLFARSDAVAEAEADARAEADLADGRLIGHDTVRRWPRFVGFRRQTAAPARQLRSGRECALEIALPGRS